MDEEFTMGERKEMFDDYDEMMHPERHRCLLTPFHLIRLKPSIKVSSLIVDGFSAREKRRRGWSSTSARSTLLASLRTS
jgi:hypothetical protein